MRIQRLVRRAGVAMMAASTLTMPLAGGRAAAVPATINMVSAPPGPVGGLDIQSATQAVDAVAATDTFTITDYQTFGDSQATLFAVLIDTTGAGIADYWAVVSYNTSSGMLEAGVGPAGSFHLSAGTVSRPTQSSVAVTVPLSAIGGAGSFNWSVISVAAPIAPGSAPVADSAPSPPTAHLLLPTRIAGGTRVETAVQSSFFTPGSAGAVVLARDDAYPDALGGAPLAAAKNAPLLLTPPTSLDPETLAEIKRVLPAGGTVYLLGGLSALSQAVEDAVKAAGYTTVRYAGTDRFDTSLQIVEQGLADPTTIFLTTGADFPDALSAGAAAAGQGGGILLTNGSQMPASISAYLQAHAGDTLYAIGGPAAAAAPTATPIFGPDRYSTSTKVAETFFEFPVAIGIASGVNYPDALAGGATMGQTGGPLLLTDPAALPSALQTYLTSNKSVLSLAFIFGGTSAVSDGVRAAIGLALGG